MVDTPPFLDIQDHLSDPAEPASFPQAILRHRNQAWAERIGLGGLSETDWIKHFAEFAPLPGNLPGPRAMRYHGHQFHVYNPDIGDGRGFLFAQLQDDSGRWLDLGTKGSGQTKYSRQGDGRLTLKGGVREILAATYLEAFGVKTSKAFSLIETGEDLHRNDEPSPTRSSVLTRLSHSHIRFGSFQRLAYFEDKETMAALVDHCLSYYYPEAAERPGDPAVTLLQEIIQQTARMVGSWMPTGFVHGVMNTDNFNITGETFDFGPWRFLPRSDPNFTAAYFDHQGLYRFGRQPLQGLWALQALAGSLTLICDEAPLKEALSGYEAAFQDGFIAHTHALFGLQPLKDRDANLQFLQEFFAWMTDTEADWPQLFFDWFGGEASEARARQSLQAALYSDAAFDPIHQALMARIPARPERLEHAYFQAERPVSMLIDEVEALWAPIAEADDWSAYQAKLDHIEQARIAYELEFDRAKHDAK